MFEMFKRWREKRWLDRQAKILPIVIRGINDAGWVEIKPKEKGDDGPTYPEQEAVESLLIETAPKMNLHLDWLIIAHKSWGESLRVLTYYVIPADERCAMNRIRYVFTYYVVDFELPV